MPSVQRVAFCTDKHGRLLDERTQASCCGVSVSAADAETENLSNSNHHPYLSTIWQTHKGVRL